MIHVVLVNNDGHLVTLLEHGIRLGNARALVAGLRDDARLAAEVQLLDRAGMLAVLSDEPDNRILECALAGSADAIITGNRAMLALGEFRGMRIL